MWEEINYEGERIGVLRKRGGSSKQVWVEVVRFGIE